MTPVVRLFREEVAAFDGNTMVPQKIRHVPAGRPLVNIYFGAAKPFVWLSIAFAVSSVMRMLHRLIEWRISRIQLLARVPSRYARAQALLPTEVYY
ncbi:hypothetical protein [Arthrobacter sp. HLT1-21]